LVLLEYRYNFISFLNINALIHTKIEEEEEEEEEKRETTAGAFSCFFFFMCAVVFDSMDHEHSWFVSQSPDRAGQRG